MPMPIRGKMDESEFMAEVRRMTKAGTAWWITPEGFIRTVGTFEGGGCRCPIIELHRDVYQGSLKNSEVSIAIWAVGLPPKLGNQIMDAADNRGGHDEMIRARLLRACGITP